MAAESRSSQAERDARWNFYGKAAVGVLCGLLTGGVARTSEASSDRLSSVYLAGCHERRPRYLGGARLLQEAWAWRVALLQ